MRLAAAESLLHLFAFRDALLEPRVQAAQPDAHGLHRTGEHGGLAAVLNPHRGFQVAPAYALGVLP